MPQTTSQTTQTKKTIPEGWKEVNLGDFVEINPRESITKGEVAKYVAMENLTPFTRRPDKYEYKKYKGGTKFRNKDTIVARITPCLENGKTAYVDILEDNEVAFGSTEYIVLREMEGISDSKFIYYFAISPFFRNAAIRSMTGTSGRQRVQNDLISNKNILLPPLPTQKSISAILSAFDDKIELLREQNKTLEDMAQAIFKEWFVSFNFPNEQGKPYKDSGGKMIDSELGEIPEGWRVGKYNNFIELVMGQSPKGESYNEQGIGIPLLNGAADLKEDGIFPKKYTSDSKKECKKGDILFCIRATIGNINIANQVYSLGRGVASIRPKENYCYYYSLFVLKERLLKINASGSVIKGLSRNDIDEMIIFIPEKKILEKYNNVIYEIYKKLHNNNSQIQTLSTLRDSLLPKLMRGEVVV